MKPDLTTHFGRVLYADSMRECGIETGYPNVLLTMVSRGDGYGDGGGYGDGEKLEVIMKGVFCMALERGWCLIGEVSPCDYDASRVIVNNAGVLRRWGTTKGLGQLAREGIQPNTQVDWEGDGVDVHRAAIMRAIPVTDEAWATFKQSTP